MQVKSVRSKVKCFRPSRQHNFVPDSLHGDQKGGQQTAEDLHLSTDDRPPDGVQPWLKFGSARWLTFASAPTRMDEPEDLYSEICKIAVESGHAEIWRCGEGAHPKG
jgi:hypothetical protein